MRWARARADARLASWPKRGRGARATGKRVSWAGAWVACGEGNGPRGEGERGAGWAERFGLGLVSGFLLFLDFPNLFLFLFWFSNSNLFEFKLLCTHSNKNYAPA